MRHLAIVLLAAGLAGCGAGGPVALDIEEFDVSGMSLLPAGTTSGAEAVELEMLVRAGQLRTVLGRGGVFDLAIFACAAPEGPVETYPVYFGDRPISALRFNPVDDDPQMSVRLAAPVPMATLETPGRCARFVGRPGPLAPEIVSPIMPLTPDDIGSEEAMAPPPVPPPPEISPPWETNRADGADQRPVSPPPPVRPVPIP